MNGNDADVKKMSIWMRSHNNLLRLLVKSDASYCNIGPLSHFKCLGHSIVWENNGMWGIFATLFSRKLGNLNV